MSIELLFLVVFFVVSFAKVHLFVKRKVVNANFFCINSEQSAFFFEKCNKNAFLFKVMVADGWMEKGTDMERDID